MKVKYIKEGYFNNPEEVKRKREIAKGRSSTEIVSNVASGILKKKYEEILHKFFAYIGQHGANPFYYDNDAARAAAGAVFIMYGFSGTKDIIDNLADDWYTGDIAAAVNSGRLNISVDINNKTIALDVYLDIVTVRDERVAPKHLGYLSLKGSRLAHNIIRRNARPWKYSLYDNFGPGCFDKDATRLFKYYVRDNEGGYTIINFYIGCDDETKAYIDELVDYKIIVNPIHLNSGAAIESVWFKFENKNDILSDYWFSVFNSHDSKELVMKFFKLLFSFEHTGKEVVFAITLPGSLKKETKIILQEPAKLEIAPIREGYFNNPEQAKKAKEKLVNQTSAERAAGVAKKILDPIEAENIEKGFKIILQYMIDNNDMFSGDIGDVIFEADQQESEAVALYGVLFSYVFAMQRLFSTYRSYHHWKFWFDYKYTVHPSTKTIDIDVYVNKGLPYGPTCNFVDFVNNKWYEGPLMFKYNDSAYRCLNFNDTFNELKLANFSDGALNRICNTEFKKRLDIAIHNFLTNRKVKKAEKDLVFPLSDYNFNFNKIHFLPGANIDVKIYPKILPPRHVLSRGGESGIFTKQVAYDFMMSMISFENNGSIVDMINKRTIKFDPKIIPES